MAIHRFMKFVFVGACVVEHQLLQKLLIFLVIFLSYLDSFKASIVKATAKQLNGSISTKKDAIAFIVSLKYPDSAIEALVEANIKVETLTSTTSIASTSSASIPSTFIKLPKYDKANVRAWVRHCSLISNFDLKMLFSKMPTEIINKFSEDDIDNSISYDSFKDILLPKVEESIEVSLTRLLEHEELGDRKPSTFLEHLVNLADRAGQDRDSNLIRQKFIQSMPSEIKVPLSALVSTPLKELADAADKMWANFKVFTAY